MKKCYCYITVNLINGKKYIGSHISENLNDKYLGSGVILNKAIKKYGKENFKRYILAEVDSSNMMKELEEYYIEYYNAYTSSHFYNATKYAAGITKFPEDKKINISKANKKNKYNLGKKHTSKTLQKMSNIKLGKKLSQETKDKIGESKRGNQYALGNKFTKEQKNKIIEKKSKPIIQFDLDGNFIKEWESATKAAQFLNKYDSSSISNCLNHKIKTAYGFNWKFKN